MLVLNAPILFFSFWVIYFSHLTNIYCSFHFPICHRYFLILTITYHPSCISLQPYYVSLPSVDLSLEAPSSLLSAPPSRTFKKLQTIILGYSASTSLYHTQHPMLIIQPRQYIPHLHSRLRCNLADFMNSHWSPLDKFHYSAQVVGRDNENHPDPVVEGSCHLQCINRTMLHQKTEDGRQSPCRGINIASKTFR